jgi:hypothetical protein
LKTIVMPGMSRLAIGPCLMVIFLCSLSTFRITPSVFGVAAAAEGAGTWVEFALALLDCA